MIWPLEGARMSWFGIRATLHFLPSSYSCSSLSVLWWNLPSFTGMAGFFCRKPRSMKKSTRGMKISNARTHCRDKHTEKQVMKATWAAMAGGYVHLHILHAGCNLFGWTSEVLHSSTGLINKDGLLNSEASVREFQASWWNSNLPFPDSLVFTLKTLH